MASPTAAYVALSSRLAQSLRLQPNDSNSDALCSVLDELSAFLDGQEVSSGHGGEAPQLSLLPAAAMDDLVLLSLHKLLLGYVSDCGSARVQESAFRALLAVLGRSARSVQSTPQKLLSFVQSCVLFLPTPEAAVDTTAGETGTSLADQSEELRLAVLSCLRLLFSAYDLPDLRQSQSQQPIRRRRPTLVLESTAHMHFMAYLVSALLHVAQHDRCREAALLAMETLTRIIECLETNPLAMRQFLPGITGGVWNCVNAPNQASKVVVAAVECLAQAIKVCLADGIPENNAQQQQSQYSLEALREITSKNSSQHATGSEERDEGVDTSPSENADKWLTETAVNMDIILSRMFTIGQRAHHQASWRIRCALADLCGVVVLECRATLRDSFFRCFEELLVYQVDRIPEVSEAARHMSDQLNAVLTTDEWLAMLPAFADRFEMQLSTLVLKCATEHEAFSAHIMKKMTGYLSFLGGRLRPFLDRSMELTYRSLCRVLQFEAMDIDLIVHQTVTKSREMHADDQNPSERDGESLVVSHYQKRLKYFHEQEAVDATFELLHAIGAVCTPAVFIDCAFALLLPDYDAGAGEEQSDANSSTGAEVMLILNELLRAFCASSQPRKSDDEKKSAATPAMSATTFATVDIHLAGRVLEDLLALDVWSEQSSLEPKARVNQRALMVECVGVCVEILGRDFAVFLLHVLYPLVEKLGSRSLQVERAALATLSKIYFLCDYESMEALFEANIDYFVDALCSRLENLDDFPLTALVVEALLRHTRIASLPLADEVTHSLLRSVDMYQESPFTDGLLRSLHSLLRSISSGPDKTSESMDVLTKTDDKRSSDPSMLSRFLAEMNALAVGDDDDYDDDNKEAAPRFQEVEDGEGTAADTPNVKAAMPLEYDEGSALGGGPSNDEDGDEDEDRDGQLDPMYRALAVEILDRSGYFVATPEPVACCQVLALMQDGFILLSHSQKQLLPLIHRLWPSLLPRLHAKSRAIVTATARVISTLADVAGDFIASRFVEDVWPEFRRQLEGINFEEHAPKITRSMLLLNVSNSHTETVQDASGEEAESMANARQVASLGRKTQEIQQLLAILSCITTIAQHTDAVSSLVPEVLASCAKFLHRAVPSEIVDVTTTLLLALYDLNGDEVFCAVAALADWDPPRSAPSARFPSFSIDSTRQFYRSQLATFKAGAFSSGDCAANAAQVMRRLTETRR